MREIPVSSLGGEDEVRVHARDDRSYEIAVRNERGDYFFDIDPDISTPALLAIVADRLEQDGTTFSLMLRREIDSTLALLRWRGSPLAEPDAEQIGEGR